MKVENSHSFQWEKSTFSKKPIESQDAPGDLALDDPGGFLYKRDRSQALCHSVVSEKWSQHLAIGLAGGRYSVAYSYRVIVDKRQ